MSLLSRASLRKISLTRLLDAKVLLANRRFSGAYYLAGYSIEYSLKARIAQNTKKHDFPDKKTVNDSYTHDLEKLMRLAGLLQPKLEDEIKTNPRLNQFWLVVKDWNEEQRYNDNIDKRTAEDLIEAISNPTDGVMQWIEKN